MTATMLWVTAGRGPTECMEAAARVAREIVREAEEAGLSAACGLARDESSAQSVSVSLGGDGSEAFAASWRGTVLWTAKSGRRGAKSRKNWYVAVRSAETPPAATPLPESEVRYETLRAGGPGGQHQNVTDSAVRAVHIPTGLSAMARDGRSQHQNRKTAYLRLLEVIQAITERDKAAAARRDWLGKIAVERGNPVRAYEGEEMLRKP